MRSLWYLRGIAIILGIARVVVDKIILMRIVITIYGKEIILLDLQAQRNIMILLHILEAILIKRQKELESLTKLKRDYKNSIVIHS